MNRKALLIGNTRSLAATPLDLLNITLFLMSYQGGAWSMDEITYCQDKSSDEILNEVEAIKNGKYDYVLVYFTGHGGLQGDTIVEVSPFNELLKESVFFGLAERQLVVLDCCRDIITTPLNIYGSMRGMTQMEKDLRDSVRAEYETLVMCAAPQTLRLYSCAEGESSYPSAHGSYYSYNLVAVAKELLKTNDFVSVHQCHEAAAFKTTAEVQRDLKREQHPEIIPSKCLALAELPFCFNPESLK